MRETFQRALKAHIQNASLHQPRGRLNCASIWRAIFGAMLLAAIGALAVFAGLH